MARKPAAPKAEPKSPVTEPAENPAATGPVKLIPLSHFSLAINGTIVSFHQGVAFDADATMLAALTAHDAPVKEHE